MKKYTWQQKFNQVLRSEFEMFRQINPRFSIRAYSKKIGLSPTSLSDLFSGKESWQVGTERAEEVLSKLIHITDNEKNQIRVMMGRPPVKTAQTLEEGQYPLLEDKSVFPIWMCFEWPKDLRTTENIAKRLQLSPRTVDEKIAKLVAMGLLKKGDDGIYFQVHGSMKTSDEIPNKSIDAFHRNGLKLAERALELHPLESRDFQGMVFAGSKEAIAEVKEETRKFLDRLEAILESYKGNSNDVYQFSTNFFPVRVGDGE